MKEINKEQTSPNINSLITLNNRFSNWVISQIVSSDHHSKVLYIKLFIEVAMVTNKIF